MDPGIVLSIDGLSKSFGKVQAIKDLSFTVRKGQIFGLLGPNGSGKTTTLSILLNCQRPDSGSYRWAVGSDERPLRSVGALLERPNFYPHLTGWENLRWIQLIRDDDRSDLNTLLKRVGLHHRKDSKFSGYSSGMKQRLAIASSLIGDQEFLVYDEPTNALDPEGIADIRHLILELGEEGRTIILASHILAEVEKICSHCGILKKGSLLASGPVDALLGEQNEFIIRSANPQLAPFLKDWDVVQNMESTEENTWRILVEEDLRGEDINKACFERNIVLDRIEKRKNTLEEQYLSLLQE